MRILLLEKNAIIASDISLQIEEEDLGIVEQIYKADLCLDSINFHPPDLIILDIPPQNPSSVLELLFRIRVRFFLPIIIISGVSQNWLKEYLPFLEDIKFLPKPFHPFQLSEIIKSFSEVRS